jgi:hypothetical protein
MVSNGAGCNKGDNTCVNRVLARSGSSSLLGTYPCFGFEIKFLSPLSPAVGGQFN